MSGFLNSVVKGAGMSIGRNLVGDFGKSKKPTSYQKSSELECYSNYGYQEGDVEITYSRDYKKDFLAWYLYPVAIVISAIPFIGLLFNLKFFYQIFLKNNKMFFWDFKWNTITVSDRRTKSGIKDIKILQKDISRIERHYPYLRNKIEMGTCMLVSIISIIYIYNK